MIPDGLPQVVLKGCLIIGDYMEDIQLIYVLFIHTAIYRNSISTFCSINYLQLNLRD